MTRCAEACRQPVDEPGNPDVTGGASDATNNTLKDLDPQSGGENPA